MATQDFTSSEKILEVKHLKQYFEIDRHTTVKAVDDISFDVHKGEIFGLLGESGSGKSTVGRSINRIYQPTAGEVTFQGDCISDKRSFGRVKSRLRRQMQMIFQDSASAVNARMTVEQIVAEPLKLQCRLSKAHMRDLVEEHLQLVGLQDVKHRYPYDLSGGQRQRVTIARALVTNPSFLIADEPIASLDVSIQAQMMNLFVKLQKERNLTCLFIAHDLRMLEHISNRVGVMRHGKLLEVAPTQALFANPTHPYTQSLLAAIPEPDPRSKKTPHACTQTLHTSPILQPAGYNHYVFA